jgi:hypothetical protein
MKTALLSLIYVAMAAQSSLAGTFVGKAYMEFSAASGTIPRFPVDVVMTTDYSTLNWKIAWDVPETTVIGGAGQTFQTSFGTRGSMTLQEPIKLGLPDASGTVSHNGFSYLKVEDGDTVEFFGTSRVVSRNETWQTQGAGINQSYYLYPHALNVASYPASLKLTSAVHQFSGNVVVSMSTTTTDGNPVSLAGRLYRSAVGSAYGIDSLMHEELPGDFTSDGLVDAADYTVARDVSTPMTALLTDLDTWRESYGSTSSLEASSVPEPTASLIALLAIGFGFAGKRLQ